MSALTLLWLAGWPDMVSFTQLLRTEDPIHWRFVGVLMPNFTNVEHYYNSFLFTHRAMGWSKDYTGI